MLSAIERRTSRVFLSKGHWFGGLPSGLQLGMLDAAEKRRFEPRQLLYGPDEPGRGFWMLLQGQVVVADTFADGGRFLFHIGGPGYCFGETAAILESATAVEVTATTKVQALLVPMAAMQRLLAEHPEYYRDFAELIAERYRTTLRCFSQCRTLPPELYLRERLAQLAELWRRDGFQEPHIEFAMSQAELAHLLGISRQTLNRYLARLEGRTFREAT